MPCPEPLARRDCVPDSWLRTSDCSVAMSDFLSLSPLTPGAPGDSAGFCHHTRASKDGGFPLLSDCGLLRMGEVLPRPDQEPLKAVAASPPSDWGILKGKHPIRAGILRDLHIGVPFISLPTTPASQRALCATPSHGGHQITHCNS